MFVAAIPFVAPAGRYSTWTLDVPIAASVELLLTDGGQP